MTPIQQATSLKRLLKETQLREYRRLIASRGKAEALAIFKRDLIMKNGNAWWRDHREIVLAELDRYIPHEEER